MVPGMVYLPLNEIEPLEKAITEEKTAAVMVEPVQGEGGVNPAHVEFLQHLRKLCDERKVALIFDEIQCGLCRSGKLFAYQHHGIEPDVMTLAKPLAGGLPIGAVIMKPHIAEVLKPGMHGSTFGANPVACHVAHAVVSKMIEEGLADRAVEMGGKLTDGIRALAETHGDIKDVRGAGLLIGVEFEGKVDAILGACREAGLIIGTAGENVLRCAPPLVIEQQHVDEALGIIGGVLDAR